MEIKEEGTSEEGQHFLPTAQANDPEDIQFTSKYMCPTSCRSLKKPNWVTQTNIAVYSQKTEFHQTA